MQLYNLTLQPPSTITQAIVGRFSGSLQQELIVSHGTRLELLHLDAQTSSLKSVHVTNVFGSIRSIASFRLMSSTKDYVVISSDSGCIVIVEYDLQKKQFVKVHQETYGKSGSRRIVPGQYLAMDPKGRSVMIAAIEKVKLVYTLRRDLSKNITISSPLEVNTPNTITYHIVGLDVGFDNPVFAALEVGCPASDLDHSGKALQDTEKMLVFYELDLSLNHVVRKRSVITDPRANFLVQVPGGQSGYLGRPNGLFGVLVCCENYIIYHNMNAPQHRVPIPHRQGVEFSRGVLIVSAVIHQMKESFFILLQSEEGDLFKVTIEHEASKSESLTIKYFDTVPTSSSLCITKSGYLFVASEFGDKYLYQFMKLGEEDDGTEIRSNSFPLFGMEDPHEPLPTIYFRMHSLQNLILVEEIFALDPIIDSKLLAEESKNPLLVTACGRGSRSSLRILTPGIEFEEILHADIKLVPNGIWTTKLKKDDRFDQYVVLSLADRSLVLSVGEVLEETENTGLLTTQPSLAIQQVGADALLQVYPLGIRHITPSGVLTEWPAPAGLTIIAAATNNRQVAVALSSADLVYFEVDLDGHLNLYPERKAIEKSILTLCLVEAPEGQQRSSYLAIGCEDTTVRILSLIPGRTLDIVTSKVLTSLPISICSVELRGAQNHNTVAVNVGLHNGVILCITLDPGSGHLKGTRTRFIGIRPARVNAIRIKDTPSWLVMSSRSWLCCIQQNKLRLKPVQTHNLDYACSFSNRMCPEGIIGMSGSVLRVLRVPVLELHPKQDVIPLLHTPREFIIHPQKKHVYVVESDRRATKRGRPSVKTVNEASSVPLSFAKTQESSWLSCVRVIDLAGVRTLSLDNLPENEAGFSLALVPFSVCPGELHLVVGTATNVTLSPRSCSSGFLRVYKLGVDGTLELHHVTEVEDIPLALLAFQGRLVAGIGSTLKVYEMGKTKLLRKAENKVFPSIIVSLDSQGTRIIVGHMQDSISFVNYNASENRLDVFADDTQPRWVTCLTMVDYSTVAAADRFGNVFVNRLDSTISHQIDDNLQRENRTLHKTKLSAHFHVGDIVTSLHKTSLKVGGKEILLYTALHGTIGVLIPFATKEESELLLMLEQHMRAEQVSIVGRDHMGWRGYYVPVKAVVDGDLCEIFGALHVPEQARIASTLDRSIEEVLVQLDQLRAAFSGFW